MEITSPADWDAAQEQLGWFHDAVTLSLVFVNDGRVLSDSSMQMSQGEAGLKAIIQTQSRERPTRAITGPSTSTTPQATASCAFA
jgi:hypothetical protein